MHLFWYHSPVRFYRNLADLEDMTNPQNTQYFGEFEPYPLEKGDIHRFLIPNYQNEIESSDLQLWIINDKSETQLTCEFGISDGKLFRITFYSDEFLHGQLQIKLNGDTIYYSNCVQFIDSTLGDGRKFIRIATKHYYNRHLFSFDGTNHDWIITNIPAYCLGQTEIQSEISTERTSGNNSLKVKDAFSDEVVSYEIVAKGDNNILNFLQAHITNNEFYIDGTKRTPIEKLDYEEFGITGKFKVASVKEKNGLNAVFNENDAFGDVYKVALANNEKTLIYTNNNNEIIPA